MMRVLTTILVLISVMLTLTSCEKVIELDLDETDQKYVIEGLLHDSLGDNFVKISKSQHFNNQNPFVQVSNATVTISGGGSTYNLLESSPGYYTDPNLKGVPNTNYTLVVSVDGNVITANSFMPQKVELDSLAIQEDVFGEDDDEGQKYRVNSYFTDPFGLGNYYRFKGFLIEDNYPEQVEGFLAISDEYIDGLPTYFPFFDGSFLEGDSVVIQLLCIDEVNYRYFTAIEASQEGEVPGNPVSNLSSDVAVGYFGAYTKSEQLIIITL